MPKQIRNFSIANRVSGKVIDIAGHQRGLYPLYAIQTAGEKKNTGT